MRRLLSRLSKTTVHGVAALGGVAVLAACPGGAPDDEPEQVSCERYMQFLPPTQAMVDVLVVVDSSLPREVRDEALEGLEEGIEARLGEEKLQVAVISGDLGVGGAELSGCSARGDDARLLGAECTQDGQPYFTRQPLEDGSIRTNLETGLADALACAMPDERGCPLQQPLEAAARALEAPPPGFLRPGAGLAILFVTGSDDCSTTDPVELLADDPELGPPGPFRCAELGLLCDGAAPYGEVAAYETCQPDPASEVLVAVTDYAARFEALVGETRFFLGIGMAAGPLGPFEVELDPETAEARFASTCGPDAVIAAPGIRFHALEPRRGQPRLAPICSPADAADIVPFVFRGLPGRCLPHYDASDDIDPDQPGIQLNCEVTERDLESGEERRIPPCSYQANGEFDPASPRPCWRVEEEGVCGGGSFKALDWIVERHALPARPIVEIARCAC
jgi:hypothetical protein